MRKMLFATCLGVMAACGAGAANANEELIKMSGNPKDWVMPTGNYANHRYSQLKQITAANVGKLQVAWTFSTGVLRGHEGGPLVIGDLMYVHAPFPNTVYALNLKDENKIVWKYEPKQDPNVIPVMCCDTVNRGVAYADGKIFLHQADTTLVALEAKTGKFVWSVKNGDPSKGETGTSSPMIFKDKVIVGISGGEFGVRGSVTAYNMKDGKLVWRSYSMGPDSDTLIDPVKTTHLGKPVGKDSGTNTWQGEQWKIGGGSTWGWYSYDPELNLMYYGSGNPSTWNPKQRPGDNRWSMTIFARDVDTGMARWVYQMTPHDEWDYDGVNEMILSDQQVGGQARKLLTHFDRNGLGYTLDRATGELLVADKYDPKVNWTSGVDMNKSSPTYGRPTVVDQYSTDKQGEDHNVKGICPAALGTKDEQRCIRLPASPTWATLSLGTARPARSSGRTRNCSRSGRARLPRPVGWCSTERLKATSRRWMPRRARNSTSSRPRPASSATSQPMSKAGSSTWRCCRASAAGRASAWRRGCCPLRMPPRGRALRAVQR